MQPLDSPTQSTHSAIYIQKGCPFCTYRVAGECIENDNPYAVKQ